MSRKESVGARTSAPEADNNKTSEPKEPQSTNGVGKRLFRFCCGYGIQLLRRYYRVRRLARRTLRPVGAFLSRKVGRPAAQTGKELRAFAADTGRALHMINDARREGGVKALAQTAAGTTARGAVKHRSFLTSAVNYCLPVVCLVILFTVAAALFGRDYVLAVDYNGSTIGYISDESAYNDATELVGERVISSNEDFRRALRPSYSLVVADDETVLTDSGELCNTILLNTEGVEQAYGLFVDDKLIGAIKSEGDMSYVLDSFLEQYRMGADNEKLTFVGKSRIVNGLYAGEKIMSAADFKEHISATEMVTELYTIKKNDTLERITKSFSMTEERVYEMNEGFDGSLVAGRTLLLEHELPVLQVQSVVVSSYEKTIAYTTSTIKDPSQYTTYRKVKAKGVNGKQRVTEETVYIDGVRVGKHEIGRETLLEPVTEVIVVGTKKVATGNYSGPQTITGSGRFTWPVPGCTTISSPYGYRWGRLHSGIDISNGRTNGKSIVAADSGTVTSVKNSPNGYGLHLIISHGNGYSTLYAHCSKILVSPGESVSKGQTIAKVGSTGRSTGAHLHFEIRVKGSSKNPMNWF